MDPDAIAAIVVPISGCWMLVMITSRVLSYRQARALAKQDPSALAAVEQRLARVEVALDDLAADFGRVIEGQQLVARALADRSADSVPRT